GSDEEEAAALIRELKPDKPIVALVVGQNAPPERRMGHAGALAVGRAGSAEAKISALREAGVLVAPRPDLVGLTMRLALVSRNARYEQLGTIWRQRPSPSARFWPAQGADVPERPRAAPGGGRGRTSVDRSRSV